jgi:hypothetical protein
MAWCGRTAVIVLVAADREQAGAFAGEPNTCRETLRRVLEENTTKEQGTPA